MTLPESLLSNQIGVSVLVVCTLQLLKASSWFPWITANTDKLNRVLAFVIAFLTSVGFQFAVTGSYQTGGTLLITLPSLSAILSVLLHSSAQAGMQEVFYRGVVKPIAPVMPYTVYAENPGGAVAPSVKELTK